MKQVSKGNVRVGTLEFPFALYPRNHRNEEHVERLESALRAGATLPPITVEESTLRVVDGWHRAEAHRKVFGFDSEIEAEFWTYKDDQFFFLHSVRLNAIQGLTLATSDRARCLVVAKNLSIGSEKIHRVLAITPDYAKRVMEGQIDERAHPVVPLSNGLRHLRGRSLSKEQADAVPKLSNKPPGYHADQLITMMEHGLMPAITSELADQLGRLKELLEERGY